MMDAHIINLPKFLDRRGNLSFIEENNHIPFKIERAYWIYDVPGGEARGGHAYKENQEFIVALSGSFDVMLDDGVEQKIFSLNRSYYGLYVPKGGVWIIFQRILWLLYYHPLHILLLIIYMIMNNLRA